MGKTTDTRPTVKAALAKGKADADWLSAYDQYKAGLKPMQDTAFSEFLIKFIHIVIAEPEVLGPRNQVKNGATQFFRRALVDQYGMRDCMRFLKTYEELVRSIKGLLRS